MTPRDLPETPTPDRDPALEAAVQKAVARRQPDYLSAHPGAALAIECDVTLGYDAALRSLGAGTPEAQLRGVVREFAEAMEAKLKANDRKGGWERMTPSWLRRRLDTELREFDRARKAGRPVSEVLAEAADVANFLMMLADNYRRKHRALATPTEEGR